MALSAYFKHNCKTIEAYYVMSLCKWGPVWFWESSAHVDITDLLRQKPILLLCVNLFLTFDHLNFTIKNDQYVSFRCYFDTKALFNKCLINK